MCSLKRIPSLDLLRPLGLSLHFVFLLVDGPYEVVEVEEKLLVVALAAVVVLLVGR